MTKYLLFDKDTSQKNIKTGCFPEFMAINPPLQNQHEDVFSKEHHTSSLPKLL